MVLIALMSAGFGNLYFSSTTMDFWPFPPKGNYTLAAFNYVEVKGTMTPTTDTFDFVRSDIYLGHPGMTLRKIQTTTLSTEADFLAWSPDGSRAYFIANLGTANYNADGNEVFEIVVKTGKVRHLLAPQGKYTDRTMLGYPKWLAHSPDGKSLAVVHGGGRFLGRANQIDIITFAPRSQRRLTPKTLSAIDPAWSPDGRMLAFSAQPNQLSYHAQMGIHLIGADGKGLKTITTSPAEFSDEMPTFSADGKQIGFWRAGKEGLLRWVVNIDGSGLRQTGRHPFKISLDDVRRGRNPWGP